MILFTLSTWFVTLLLDNPERQGRDFNNIIRHDSCLFNYPLNVLLYEKKQERNFILTDF